MANGIMYTLKEELARQNINDNIHRFTLKTAKFKPFKDKNVGLIILLWKQQTDLWIYAFQGTLVYIEI